ncbi:MAG TPA: hypothetical protein VFC82_01115 [Actinomycetaceae bacterium]|nr:hypothetical protein [Actinomycetaceae bacterium]
MNARPSTTTWGLLAAAIGGMAIAAGLGARIEWPVITVAILVLAGLTLLVFAVLPERDALPSELSAPSELLDGGVPQQEPLGSGATEVDPGNGRGS